MLIKCNFIIVDMDFTVNIIIVILIFTVFFLFPCDRYSKILESTSLQMRAEDESGKMSEMLTGLRQKSVISVQHALVTDPEASLVLGLNHYSGGVRRAAVKQMLLDGEKVASIISLLL